MTGASWTFVQNKTGILLVGRYDPKESPENSPCSRNPKRITSFDLDSTLITTPSGNLHATSPTEWKWLHPSIPLKLRTLSTTGHTLIIFTNQGRLTTSTGTESPEFSRFKEKLDSLVEKLGVGITIYAACANDGFRKPRTGMWEYMLRELGMGKEASGGGVGVEEAYLVGDAAGRKSDHSDSDVHFCENLRIAFFTPEEFFWGEKTEERGDKFHPNWFLPPSLGGTFNAKTDRRVLEKPEKPELLVLVGLPGAGKTTYYRDFLQPLGYERINEHELGSFDECLRMADRVLADGKSVVIDEINSSSSLRKPWISLAQKHELQSRAFNFTTASDLCLHNDSVRVLGAPSTNSENRPIFPRIPFRRLQATFCTPGVEEGFAEVVGVEFEWSGSAQQLKIWRRHWL